MVRGFPASLGFPEFEPHTLADFLQGFSTHFPAHRNLPTASQLIKLKIQMRSIKRDKLGFLDGKRWEKRRKK
jgi:hypothetical protein